VDGHAVRPGELLHLPPGRTTVEVTASEEARLLLIGGPPFGEAIVMWWNFVGRSHEEVAGYRDEWQAQIAGDQVRDGRFGVRGASNAPIRPPSCPTSG
jgi:redox-sensitive bicupin YhaK (pirin superfamily)